MAESKANELKAQGNQFLKQQNFKAAIESYTQAIALDGSNAIYYGNRAAAKLKLEDWEGALSDATTSAELNPEYAKAYGRQGLALLKLKRYEEAKAAYDKAISLDSKSKVYPAQLKLVTRYLEISLPSIREMLSELPRKNVKEAEAEARKMVELLQSIADYDDPMWLETNGRVQAFLGRICFARTAWTGAFEHLEIALENLRASQTEEALLLEANFLSDFLFVKVNLRKEIRKEEIDRALDLNSDLFSEEMPVRYAQSLEMISRACRYNDDLERAIQLLGSAVHICRKHSEDPKAQLVCLNSDKNLSDMYYGLRKLDESKLHQIRVITNPCCKAGDKALAQQAVAVICKLKGEVEEGHKMLDEAIPVFESLGGMNRQTGEALPSVLLPKAMIIRAELFLSESKIEDAKRVLAQAKADANTLGLEDMLKAVSEVETRIKAAEEGKLNTDAPDAVPEVNEEEEYELIDKVNSTSVNPDKTAPFKRTQLGPNMEFIGDGVENLFTKVIKPSDRPANWKPPDQPPTAI